MNEHIYIQILCASLFNLLNAETGVNAAVALPENHLRIAELIFGVATKWLHWIPHDHFIFANTLLDGSIATKMLIREEHDALTTFEGPVIYSNCVGRRADNATVPAAERL